MVVTENKKRIQLPQEFSADFMQALEDGDREKIAKLFSNNKQMHILFPKMRHNLVRILTWLYYWCGEELGKISFDQRNQVKFDFYSEILQRYIIFHQTELEGTPTIEAKQIIPKFMLNGNQHKTDGLLIPFGRAGVVFDAIGNFLLNADELGANTRLVVLDGSKMVCLNDGKLMPHDIFLKIGIMPLSISNEPDARGNGIYSLKSRAKESGLVITYVQGDLFGKQINSWLAVNNISPGGLQKNPSFSDSARADFMAATYKAMDGNNGKFEPRVAMIMSNVTA